MSKRGRKRRGYGPTGFEEWGGYMAAKVSKLQKQFTDQANDATSSQSLFSGIAIFVNGYTEPTSEELKRLMIAHGGTYHHYYSARSTTHIIASNLPNTKIKNMNTDRVVSPKWIVDSIEAEQLLDYTKYLLYTNQSLSQPKINLFSVKKHNNIKDEKQDEHITSTVQELDEDLSNEATFIEEPDDEINQSSDNTNASNNITADLSNVISPNKNKATLYEYSHSSSKQNNKASIKSASDPNFLSEFYSNSRLHHISTMGAMFKQYVAQLQKNNDEFVGRAKFNDWLQNEHKKEELDFPEQLPSVDQVSDNKCKKTIMHIDMDCFFVSVGLRNYPQYRGKPVAVTHARGNASAPREGVDREKELRLYKEKILKKPIEIQDNKHDTEHYSMSEIASCNYEARKHGLKNGMFLGAALKLCPNLKTIPYDFEGYKEVSYKLYDIVASFTHDIEAISCDEMFLDITDILQFSGATPYQFATFLRQEVYSATQCPSSTGIGPNILTSRMATRTAKPDGIFVLTPEKINEYIKDEPIKNLPSIGSRIQEQLHSKGIMTCGDLQRWTLSQIQSELGTKTGKILHNYCRGIDDRTIKSDYQRKSVSAEVNYGIRFKVLSDVNNFIKQLSEEVENRMFGLQVTGRTITLKLKVRSKEAPVESAKFLGHGFCNNIAKSCSLQFSTDSSVVIHREVMKLLTQLKLPPEDLRGIGIQVSKLDSSNHGSSKNTPSIKDFLLTSAASKNKTTNDKMQSSKVYKTNPTLPSTSKAKPTLPSSSNTSSKTKSMLPSNSCDVSSNKSSTNKTIDMDVLLALPEDIRNDIIEEYKREGYTIAQSSSTIHTSQESGPSGIQEPHTSLDKTSSTIDDEESLSTLDSESVNADDDRFITSFSQVDKSFLEALPEDVKEELREDLHKQKERNNTKTTPQSSPVKQNTFGLHSLETRNVPSKRGRKRGSRGKKSTKSIVVNNLTKSSVPSTAVIQKIESPDNSEANDLQVSSNNNNVAISEKPNLCGEIQMNNVKSLIQDWVKSCQRPAEEDTLILVKYYTSLVTDHDLETLILLLRYLKRQILRTDKMMWNSSYKYIVDKVQEVMLETYRATLKLND